MSEAPARLHLHRSTDVRDLPGASREIAGFTPVPPPEELAPLMLAAYRGTPDDEGENLQDTIDILRATMRGRYGEWMPEASFLAIDENALPTGAILTAQEDDGTPFVAFVFVDPDHCGRGTASGLIARTCRALSASGHQSIRLWVGASNQRAVRLYRHLGFVDVID